MRISGLSLLVLLMTATVPGQTAIHTGIHRLYHTTTGFQSVVRDRADTLYTAYGDMFNQTQRDIVIARSTDGGKSWNMKWMTGFAYNPSADLGNYAPCLVIDSGDNLHCSWWHAQTSSASSRSIRYNRWDASTRSWGTEWDVTGLGYKFNIHALALDSRDHVWFIHSKKGATWKCDVERSDKPRASDMKFTPVSPAFSTQATCQNVNLIVDALDRIHVSYYSNQIPGASVYHRYFNGTQWSPETILGNSNSVADGNSYLTADAQGNVYIFYGVDTQSGKTPDPFWELRKWEGATGKWSRPVSVYKTTRAQFKIGGTDNDGRVFCAACDETTGEVYFVYRNFDTGEFLLERWHEGDRAPSTYAKLKNTGSTLPPNSLNYFIFPQVRGALFPTTNRVGAGLDLMYTVGDQNAPSPKYTLYFDSFPIGSLGSPGIPQIGTTFSLDLLAVRDPNLSYFLALSMTDITPGIGVGRRIIPLVPDSMFFLTALNLVPAIFQKFLGTLDSSGAARAGIAIPNVPALVNIKFHAAFVTYPVATGVKTISNPFTFTITK